jgi:hypothetical protein
VCDVGKDPRVENAAADSQPSERGRRGLAQMKIPAGGAGDTVGPGARVCCICGGFPGSPPAYSEGTAGWPAPTPGSRPALGSIRAVHLSGMELDRPAPDRLWWDISEAIRIFRAQILNATMRCRLSELL